MGRGAARRSAGWFASAVCAAFAPSLGQDCAVPVLSARWTADQELDIYFETSGVQFVWFMAISQDDSPGVQGTDYWLVAGQNILLDGQCPIGGCPNNRNSGCTQLGRTRCCTGDTDAQPTPQPPGAPACSKYLPEWSDCSNAGHCCQSGFQCYRRNQYYAQCRAKCTEPGWDCTVKGSSAPSPASSVQCISPQNANPDCHTQCVATGQPDDCPAFSGQAQKTVWHITASNVPTEFSRRAGSKCATGNACRLLVLCGRNSINAQPQNGECDYKSHSQNAAHASAIITSDTPTAAPAATPPTPSMAPSRVPTGSPVAVPTRPPVAPGTPTASPVVTSSPSASPAAPRAAVPAQTCNKIDARTDKVLCATRSDSGRMILASKAASADACAEKCAQRARCKFATWAGNGGGNGCLGYPQCPQLWYPSWALCSMQGGGGPAPPLPPPAPRPPPPLPPPAPRPPPPPPQAPPTIPEQIQDTIDTTLTSAAGGAGTAAVVSGSPTSVTMAARTAVAMEFSKCEMDDLDLEEGVPLEFEMHPTGLAIGSSPYRYLVGAAIMNPVFVLAITALLAAAAGLYVAVGGAKWEEAQGTFRCPGLSAIPLMFVMQGTVLAAERAALYPSPAPAYSQVIGFASMLLCAATMPALYLVLLRGLTTDLAVQMTDPRLSPKEGICAELLERSGESPPAVLSGWKRALYSFAFGKHIWVSIADGAHDCERFGGYFEAYTERYSFFILIELAQMFLLGAVAAWHPVGDQGECCGRNIVATLLLIGGCAVVLYLRPYTAPLDLWVTAVTAVFTAIAVLGMTSDICAGGEPRFGWVAGLLLLVSGIIVGAKAIFDLVLFLLDLILSRRAAMRQAARKGGLAAVLVTVRLCPPAAGGTELIDLSAFAPVSKGDASICGLPAPPAEVTSEPLLRSSTAGERRHVESGRMPTSPLSGVPHTRSAFSASPPAGSGIARTIITVRNSEEHGQSATASRSHNVAVSVKRPRGSTAGMGPRQGSAGEILSV